jgi:hypothetical protein
MLGHVLSRTSAAVSGRSYALLVVTRLSNLSCSEWVEAMLCWLLALSNVGGGRGEWAEALILLLLRNLVY